MGADPLIEAHPARDLEHVRAGLLADVGDLVDERDLRRQERVGGELDHLGAGDVGAHERSVERLVELDDGIAGPVALVTDHDAVGVQEVLERRALLEELGAGHVREARLAVLLERAPDRGARAHRHGRLHHQRVMVGRRHRADHGVDRRQVGVARVGRRRADGDEQQPRVLERGRDLGPEVQALAVSGHALGQPRLVDRDLAAFEPGDLVGIDVDAPDLAAELRKARRGDQSHVAGADDCNRFASRP